MTANFSHNYPRETWFEYTWIYTTWVCFQTSNNFTGHLAFRRRFWSVCILYIDYSNVKNRPLIGSTYPGDHDLNKYICTTWGCIHKGNGFSGWTVLERLKKTPVNHQLFFLNKIISLIQMIKPFIWTNWNFIRTMMLCDKYGWNRLSGFGEKDKIVRS